jgi:AcrR family transcriptional regulator
MERPESVQAEPRGAALALILAAERLVAAHGSDVVTLKDINEAAGVANTSAVNYHFGSREALLLAVFEYRVVGINARRQIYLDELARTDKLLDQRSLIRAVIHPLSEQLVLRPEGNYYLRFLERIRRERARDLLLWAKQSGLPTIGADTASSWGEQPEAPKLGIDMASLLTSWVDVERRIARTLAWLPSAVADFRMQLFREQVVSALASIEEMLELGATSPAAVPAQIEMLVDAAKAMLVGPISPPVFEMLDVASQS